MGFNCGIVGLPNVGKSTLFNALTQTIAAQAANFPFCTIEPNTGRVAVPDARLDKLAEIVKRCETCCKVKKAVKGLRKSLLRLKIGRKTHIALLGLTLFHKAKGERTVLFGFKL